MDSVIGWLRKGHQEPAIELAGRTLPIAIRRHPTARRMTMRLAPDGGEVRITLPRWARTAEAVAFAHARASWLADQLARVAVSPPLSADGMIFLRGRALKVLWSGDAPRGPGVAGDSIHVGGPEAAIAARLRRWLEREARDLFERDLVDYCGRAGLSFPPLKLSRAQRRWGSCSGKGEIRLNWRLVQAPDFVRRSVVAHEVAHLVHFDHSPAFHAQLVALFEGDLTEANRWLRARGRSLYAQFG